MPVSRERACAGILVVVLSVAPPAHAVFGEEDWLSGQNQLLVELLATELEELTQISTLLVNAKILLGTTNEYDLLGVTCDAPVPVQVPSEGYAQPGITLRRLVVERVVEGCPLEQPAPSRLGLGLGRRESVGEVVGRPLHAGGFDQRRLSEYT